MALALNRINHEGWYAIKTKKPRLSIYLPPFFLYIFTDFVIYLSIYLSIYLWNTRLRLSGQLAEKIKYLIIVLHKPWFEPISPSLILSHHSLSDPTFLFSDCLFISLSLHFHKWVSALLVSYYYYYFYIARTQV